MKNSNSDYKEAKKITNERLKKLGITDYGPVQALKNFGQKLLHEDFDSPRTQRQEYHRLHQAFMEDANKEVALKNVERQRREASEQAEIINKNAILSTAAYQSTGSRISRFGIEIKPNPTQELSANQPQTVSKQTQKSIEQQDARRKALQEVSDRIKFDNEVLSMDLQFHIEEAGVKGGVPNTGNSPSGPNGLSQGYSILSSTDEGKPNLPKFAQIKNMFKNAPNPSMLSYNGKKMLEQSAVKSRGDLS